MSARFQHNNHSIFNISYHIIWIPKYRSHILKGKIKKSIEKSLIDKAKDLNISIVQWEIMSDHIHLFIKCGPDNNISHIVGQLKGSTSYILRKEYPEYKKYKALWAPSYYCESIGHISEKTIIKYMQINGNINKINRPDSSPG